MASGEPTLVIDPVKDVIVDRITLRDHDQFSYMPEHARNTRLHAK